jgi:hypothetical protein
MNPRIPAVNPGRAPPVAAGTSRNMALFLVNSIGYTLTFGGFPSIRRRLMCCPIFRISALAAGWLYFYSVWMKVTTGMVGLSIVYLRILHYPGFSFFKNKSFY